MELKYTMATVFLFFLLLDLPHFSSGHRDRLKGEAHEGSSMEEVYEIDYKGPETHPVMPLPSGGRPRFRPQHPNSKPLGQSRAPKVNFSYIPYYHHGIMTFFSWEFPVEHTETSTICSSHTRYHTKSLAFKYSTSRSITLHSQSVWFQSCLSKLSMIEFVEAGVFTR